MNTPKRYPKAFKKEAVQLSYSSGKMVAQQASDLGIGEYQLHAWRRAMCQQCEQAFVGNCKAHDTT
jgi:transposase-like protein